jgi:hypothetical protein
VYQIHGIHFRNLKPNPFSCRDRAFIVISFINAILIRDQLQQISLPHIVFRDAFKPVNQRAGILLPDLLPVAAELSVTKGMFRGQ